MAAVALAGVGVIGVVPARASGAAHSARTPHLGVPAARVAAARVAADPLADPTSDTAPSQAFMNACYAMSTTKAANDTCDAAALVDFDAVRTSEGLGPMTLPAGFDTLSVPLQLLAISDIERVDRGLPPVAGLSSSLDAFAQTGADADDDPPFPDPFTATYGTGNWAGAGNSALLDDFFWMYDDGYGSGNLDCTSPIASGCWGHRHDILADFDDPIRMGAAVAYNTTYGTSMTEEFLGGGTGYPVDVTPDWATVDAAAPAPTASPTFTVAVTKLALTADTANSASGSVTVTGTGGAQQLSAATSGPGWSVSPTSCALDDDSCTFSVGFDPARSGRSTGTLAITGPMGTAKVALSGWQAPPRLSTKASAHKVARRHRVKVTAVVTTYAKRVGLAQQRVELQRRWPHSGLWHIVARGTSAAGGVVHFVLRPARSASYRTAAVTANGVVEATSSRVKIRIRRRR